MNFHNPWRAMGQERECGGTERENLDISVLDRMLQPGELSDMSVLCNHICRTQRNFPKNTEATKA